MHGFYQISLADNGGWSHVWVIARVLIPKYVILPVTDQPWVLCCNALGVDGLSTVDAFSVMDYSDNAC